MDVYMVALSATRYELYCEVDSGGAETGVTAQTGWRTRVAQSFRQVVDFVEREREKRHASVEQQEQQSRWTRLRDRVIAWLAERIAEQRLLWHLRGAEEATLHYPSDMKAADVQERVSMSLRHDARRHAGWMVIDFIAYLACLPLTPLPGPNLPAFYFVFRTVGHVFAWMGARHGMTHVAWHLEPSEPLAKLRSVSSLTGVERYALVHEIADRLQLRRLDAFLERTLPAAA
jgi:Mitochondrial K+-H+ exchange-related